MRERRFRIVPVPVSVDELATLQSQEFRRDYWRLTLDEANEVSLALLLLSRVLDRAIAIRAEALDAAERDGWQRINHRIIIDPWSAETFAPARVELEAEFEDPSEVPEGARDLMVGADEVAGSEE